ncbi:MAG: outer membrane protein assembly factor BamA [candidate division Zixibacteria bacterium]|nr:outer membrane protein assembly factor BamA [candidate division Zixibacteria bacterium]
MRLYVFTIVLVLLIASMATAEVNDYNGLTITSVKLSETAAVDSFLIFNSSGLIPGETLTAGRIQDAVKKLYALGIFSDVSILGEKSATGVDIFIEIKSYPRVSKIKFEGNNKIKDKKLKKEITINEGRIVSPGAIKSNVQLIKNLYEDKGYLTAKVNSSIVPNESDPGKATLTFTIEEGTKIKIRGISFVGNEQFTDNKLRSKISTKQKSHVRTGTFDSEKFREDKKKLIDFYKKEGYIDAAITADSVIHGLAKIMRYTVFSGTTYVDIPALFIKIHVDEGQRYYFGDFTWEGNEIFDDRLIGSVFNVEDGEKYNQEKYDEMLFKLYELYQDEGYWYVQIDDKKTPRDNILDVNFSMVENQPVHVRLIHIEGNSKTKDKVIRRELRIKPNSIFRRSVLGRSLREVMILNFFGNATPDWNILDNGDIDLIIKVEEKPTGQFQLGAGYSGQDKLVGTVGLGMPNFLGGGQTVNLNIDYGKLRQTFSLSYFEPWFLDTPTSLGTSVYAQERDWYGDYSEGRRGGSLRVGRRLRWPDNYFKIFSSYTLEELKYWGWYEIPDTMMVDTLPGGEVVEVRDSSVVVDYTSYTFRNLDNPFSVDKPDWPLITSSMNLSIERDSRDLAQFATKGSQVYWSGELGGTILGGNYDYWKQIVSAEFYLTPFWKLTFALKAKWGMLDGIHHSNSVPPNERFTPGGTDPDGIVRGYEDSNLGILGYNGGRSESIYNFEMVFPLVEQQFYALLFADAGNAWPTGDDFEANFYKHKKLYKSVGFGFRVVAPMIGIIGFDFGIPLNGLKADQGKLKPHFQIGRGF